MLASSSSPLTMSPNAARGWGPHGGTCAGPGDVWTHQWSLGKSDRLRSQTTLPLHSLEDPGHGSRPNSAGLISVITPSWGRGPGLSGLQSSFLGFQKLPRTPR